MIAGWIEVEEKFVGRGILEILMLVRTIAYDSY